MSNVSDSVVCPVCGESIPSDYVVCPYDGSSLVKQLREKVKVKIKFREGINRSLRLAFRPQETKTVIDEYITNPDRKGALFVFFAASFFFAFRIGPYLNAATDRSSDLLYFIILGLIAGLVIGPILFFFALIFWYGITFIYYIAAKYSSGSQTATYKDSQGLIGYMFAPLIGGLLIFNVILFFIVPNGFSSIYNVGNIPGGILNPITVGTSEQFFNDYWLFNFIFFAIFLVWGGWIVSIGTEKLFRTSKIQARLIAASVPIILIWLVFFS